LWLDWLGPKQIKEVAGPAGSSFECTKQIFGVPFKELLFLSLWPPAGQVLNK